MAGREMGSGKSNPWNKAATDSVDEAGVGLAWNLRVSVVGREGGRVVVVVVTCLGLAVTTLPLARPSPFCLAGKDLNLLELEDLGLSSTAPAGRPLRLTRTRLLSPLCLPRGLTGTSSSLLSSCISRMAALASSDKFSSGFSASSVGSDSSASLAVARRAFRAGEAWERRRTLEVVVSALLICLPLLVTRLPGASRDLTGFLPGILLCWTTSSSSSGLLVVVFFLKLILVI